MLLIVSIVVFLALVMAYYVYHDTPRDTPEPKLRKIKWKWKNKED